MLCPEWTALDVILLSLRYVSVAHLDLDGIRIQMDLVTFTDPICKNCCGSGSGIRCLDPGPEMGKISIRDEHFGSYFRKLRNNFLG